MAQQKTVELKLSNASSVTGDNFATVAERLMKAYMDGSGKQLTMTKLRGIYSLVMNIYARINCPDDYERHKSDIQYLKVRMAYEAGREDAVKDFLKATGLKNAIDSVTNFDQFMLYCRYAESLVAYFKYFGGEER